MKKDSNHIDQLFKDKLYNHEAPAPEGLWQKIDDKMKFKRKKMWWTVAGAMAASFALIISAGIGYYLGFNDQEKFIVKTEKVQEHNSSAKIENSSNEEKKQITQSKALNSKDKVQAKNNVSSGKKNTKASDDNLALTSQQPANQVTLNEKAKTIATNENINNQPNENKENTENEAFQLLALNSKEVDAINQEIGQMDLAIVYANYEKEAAAQAEIAKTEKKYARVNWIIGGVIAPVYSYRTIMENNTGFSSKYFNDSEKALYTYTGGINIQMEQGRFRLETGLFYSNMGQKIENILSSNNNLLGVNYDDLNEYYKSDGLQRQVRNSSGNIILNSNGNIDLNRVGTSYAYSNVPVGEKAISNFSNAPKASATQIFHYIEIPFIGHYRIISKYVRVSFSGGLSANFLVGNKVFINKDGSNELAGETTNVKKFNYAGITGLSFEIPMSSRLMFRLEPRVRYYLNSIVESESINTHPYTFGMYSGISYKF